MARLLPVGGAAARRGSRNYRCAGGDVYGKVYGVTFLGAPRTKEAENATVHRS
ncbi:hypothetical protein ACLK1T_19535 [Escherichia coli]